MVRFTKQLNEVTDDVLVATVEEGGGNTSVTGTTGTTNTVNVIIDIGRKVKVDNMGNVWDIKATSGNGGGNHDRSVALAEGLKSHFTLSLGSVTMDRSSGVVVGDKVVGQYVCRPLSLDEDKGQATPRFHSEDVEEDGALVRVLNVLDLLGDVLGSGANTAYGEEDVVLEEIFGQDLNVAREGSAEHEGLALNNAGHVLSLNYTTNLVFETHVEHAIRFVKDEVTDVGEADATTLDQINEASGSSA